MKLAAGAVVALTTVGSIFPAAAQQTGVPFTAAQCENAKSIIIGLLERYRGRITAEMATSMGNFTRSNCDLSTNFVRQNAADEEAFAELRVRLVALRTAPAEAPKR